MSGPVVIGMDPGISGAIAILSLDGQVLELHDMPVFAVTKKVKGKDRTKRHIDVHGVGTILRPYLGRARAAVERVSSQPGEGSVSSFTFGFAAGALHGALGMGEVPFALVTPQSWKKHFRLTSDKNEARQAATRRWPAVVCERVKGDCDPKPAFARVADAGRAEACLIGLHFIETSNAAAAADTRF